MIVVVWNYKPPLMISLYEHCKSLAMMLAQTYIEGGRPGCIVTSPEIASILETQLLFRAAESSPGPVREIGTLKDIPVWVDVDIVRNEALATAGPEDMYPTAKLVVQNLLFDVDLNALDYLSRL